MKRATKREIADLIFNTDGRFFTVTFKKKSNGEIRTLTGRLGVTKHLKGGEKSYSDEEKNLITVYDTGVEGYRCFGIETLICATIDKEDFLAV